MLSTAGPTAPPSSTLLLHHTRRRRRRYLDSHLHAPSSNLSPRRPPSQHPHPQPPSLSPSSPLRFDRAASPPSSPPAPAMGDYRHMRSGSLNIPSQGGAAAAAAAPAPGPAHGRFDGPRSPPSMSQRSGVEMRPAPFVWSSANGRRASIADTSHVPCKFFRQGACQAGSACPFSHDLGAASETVCKYFAKVRDLKALVYDNCPFTPLFRYPLPLSVCLRFCLGLQLQPRHSVSPTLVPVFRPSPSPSPSVLLLCCPSCFCVARQSSGRAPATEPI
ncbi:hypothetical protein GGR55DRAFT_509513 [Xylaria sp. FL0064]|nr:hypothetical protein GGR55DRAFT_509513 [Xylaria sp. FL0064]